MEKRQCGGVLPDGDIVWQWPEFQAFATRLGVVLDKGLLTTGLVITLKVGETVTITQTYLVEK